jgi:hypothetical protein
MRKSSWGVVLLGVIVVAGTVSLTPMVSCVPPPQGNAICAQYTISGHVYLYDGTSAGGYAPLLSSGGATVDITWWNTSIGYWDTIAAPTNGLGEYNTNINDYIDGEVVFLNATFDNPYNNKGYNYTYINSTAGSSSENVVCGVPYNVTITNPLPFATIIAGMPFIADWQIVDRDGVLAQGYFTWNVNPFRWLAEDPAFVPPPATTWDGTSTVPGPGIAGPGLGTDTLTICFGPTCWINITEGGAELPIPDNFLTPWGEFYIDPLNTIPGFLKDWDNITLLGMGGGGFDWLLDEGYNLVSAPLNPLHKGSNGIFDADDALNRCFFYTNDPNMFMLRRDGGNPSTYTRNDYGIGEVAAFPIDGVHGYWIYCSVPGPYIVHFNGTGNYSTPGANQVTLVDGWNLLGFTHDYTPWGMGGPTGSAPCAADFTNGNVDPALYTGGPVGNKIVVSRWDYQNQWWESYVETIWFPGMASHNWQWDLSYSMQPGNGFMLWCMGAGTTITFDTSFGSQPGGNTEVCGVGGENPGTYSDTVVVPLSSPPIPPLPFVLSNSNPDDPHPTYGRVYDEVFNLVPGADVYIEWENITGTVINNPNAFPFVSTASAQYSVDMLDYAPLSTIWANASYSGDTGENMTFVSSPPTGGQEQNISLGFYPDIWIDTTSYNFTTNGNSLDSQDLVIGNNGLNNLNYDITCERYTVGIYQDTYDGEAEGTSPPLNWIPDNSPHFIPLSCEVDDTHSNSGQHSMFLESPSAWYGFCHHDIPGGFTEEPYCFSVYPTTSSTSVFLNTQNTVGNFDSAAIAARVAMWTSGIVMYYDGGWIPTGYSYVVNSWNNFKIVHDCNNNTYDCWLNGALIIDDGPFFNPSTSIRSLHFGANSEGTPDYVWIDDVKIGNSTEVNWLSVIPDNGMITPTNNATHSVIVNTTGLAPGFYQANISIDSNDPDESVILIPVNLTVTSAESYDVNLQLGWNLISFPLVPFNTSIEAVLSSISGNWDVCQAYDGSDPGDPWKTYATFKPPPLNDLWDLDNTMGFWLHVTDASSPLVIQGEKPVETNITLIAGWNLVGYPTLKNETVGNALFGTGADIVMVQDNGEPYRIKVVGGTYVMHAGEGYWIHVPFDTVWTVVFEEN